MTSWLAHVSMESQPLPISNERGCLQSLGMMPDSFLVGQGEDSVVLVYLLKHDLQGQV